MFILKNKICFILQHLTPILSLGSMPKLQIPNCLGKTRAKVSWRSELSRRGQLEIKVINLSKYGPRGTQRKQSQLAMIKLLIEL